jgi:protein disulfide-isomerase
MNKVIGITVALGLILSAVSVLGSETAWLTDFDQAKKEAAETKRPILMNFSGSDWCGWCIRLSGEVFSKEDFQKYAKEKLILFMADFPARKAQADELKKQNNELAKQYGVRGFPTVLILDAEGKVLARTGYRSGGVQAYVKHLDSLLEEKEKDKQEG